MRMKIFTLAALCSTVMAATAQTPAPACNSEETRSHLVQIIKEQVVPGDRYRAVPLNVYLGHIGLENAGPISFDKSVGRYECSGSLVIDSSRGLDNIGKALIGSPQALSNAGSNVAQLERVMASDLKRDRKIFSFPLRFSSQITEGQHRLEIDNILPLRAMLLGSFISAHSDAIPK